ncbi:MAG: hypothetical protein P8L85_19830 [Rubripirellula sp.]|nr:hypothetical protein [Rubripirellula sp.]
MANRIGAAKLIGSTYRIPSGEIWIRTTKSQLIEGKPRPNTSTRRIKGTNLSLGKLPQERDAIVVNTSEFTVEIQLQATSSAKPPGLPSLPRSPPKNASYDPAELDSFRIINPPSKSSSIAEVIYALCLAIGIIRPISS